MIQLFNINNYNIDTSKYSNFLHDKIVEDFVKEFCSFVGAKYGCAVNSATNAIFLATENKKIKVTIPSLIPPVVANAILLAGNEISFRDDTKWVGNSYILHDFVNYKIIDSAQKVDRNQFFKEANDSDLMIFSFYPTKPVGGMDGGIIVSNDKHKIDYFKERSFNGMTFSENNWDRIQTSVGWKMYMNSVQAQIALNNLHKLEFKKKRLDQIRSIYNDSFDINNTSDHLYRINIKDRDFIMDKLKNSGIATGIHYKCLHKHKLFMNQERLHQSETEEKTTLSIPFHENLTNEEVNFTICQIKSLIS